MATTIAGKYLLDADNGEEVIFLLNSNGEIKILENDYYYSITVSRFFTEFSLDIESGGDEQVTHAYATLTVKNNKLVFIEKCEVLVDGPNEWLSEVSLKLLKWNKKNKKYEQIKNTGSKQSNEKCYNNLILDYRHFN
jgi:hypothetical protein